MSVNNYQSTGGLPIVSPNQTVSTFNSINRDKIFDVNSITHKLKLAKRATINVNKFYATARLDSLDSTEVNMPYTGNMDITVTGSDTDDIIFINNPFVDVPNTHFVINTSPDPNATLIRGNPGQLILTLTDGNDGVYSIGVNIKSP